MNEKIISEYFTFDEICKILKNRGDDFWEFFDNIFSFALLFFPNIKIPFGLNNSIFEGEAKVKLMSAKNALKDCRKSINKIIKKHNSKQYYKKYNDIELSNFLLIFASYFDAIEDLLPDKDYCIHLDNKEKIKISQNKYEEYFLSLNTNFQKRSYAFNTAPRIPSLIVPYQQSLSVLSQFYTDLTEEFKRFYENLLSYETLKEKDKDKVQAKLNSLPEVAVKYYQAEYFALKEEFTFYKAYATTAENQQAIDIITNAIQDFRIEHEQWAYKYTNEKVGEIFNRLEIHYQNAINKKILYGDNKEDYETTMLPVLKDIFIPQSFKYLIYDKSLKNKTIRLEPDSTWENLTEYDNLSEYIHGALNHPIFGRKPLIVLGNPGAGKSTLCNMLAAKIFQGMYHTIVVRLREVNANDEISTQIEQQIYKTLHTNCSWSYIRDNLMTKEDKPLLLIFDGFDELLQASGKEYRNYIKTIQKFQADNERDYGFFVRSIITSRRTLIDTADISNNSVIINLSEFNYDRIQIWSTIWNEKNKKYFSTNHLNPLNISESDNYYILAKQPLLLTLLALYDYNGNALSKDKKLDITQLYHNIICDFIEREKNKSVEFRKNGTKAKKELDSAFFNLNIAAIGMYNRNSITLSSDEFISDLKCFNPKITDGNDDTLNEGLKTFGSFFFVNTSKSVEEIKREIEPKNAYEFLHNTFGEFLAGNFILKQCFDVIEDAKYAKSKSRDFSLPLNWYLCLSYVPLFSRANIIQMINLEAKHSYERLNYEAFDYMIKKEFDDIISGRKIIDLHSILNTKSNPYFEDKLMLNLATYSINLIILSAIIFESNYKIKLTINNWQKLLNIWKYAFDEDALIKFANIFRVHHLDDTYVINYLLKANNALDSSSEKHETDRLNKLHSINTNLSDEINACLTGSLVGDLSLSQLILNNNLKTQSACAFSFMLQRFKLDRVSIMHIHSMLIKESNPYYMNLFYGYINKLLDQSRTLLSKKDVKYIISEGLRFINDDYIGLCITSELINLSSHIKINQELFINFAQYFEFSYHHNLDYICLMLKFYTQNIEFIFSLDFHEILYYIEKFTRFYLEDHYYQINKLNNNFLETLLNFIKKIILFMKKKHKISRIDDHLYKSLGMIIQPLLLSNAKHPLSMRANQDLIFCLNYYCEIAFFSKLTPPHESDRIITSALKDWYEIILKELYKYQDEEVLLFLMIFYRKKILSSNFYKNYQELTSICLCDFIDSRGIHISLELLRTISHISDSYLNKRLSTKINNIKQQIYNSLDFI